MNSLINRMTKMMTSKRNMWITFSLVMMGLLVGPLTESADAQIAVKGEIVYTIDGDPIQDGVVLIRDGKIERVGSANRVRIPSGYEVHEAKVVTPGMIDARTVVGLAGYYNQQHDQDILETSNAVQPELRAMDAYNAQEFLVGFVKSKGMTTLHTGHGPGAVMSGQTMIVKSTGRTLDEALVDSTTMIAITLGSRVRSNFSSPGTRSKTVSVLRQELIDAQAYADKRAEGEDQSRDLKKEVLADLLDGKVKAMVSANTASDIVTALRIQREFGFPMVLEGAAEA